MSADATNELSAWPDRLEALAKRCDHVRRIVVMHETDSTQHAARRLELTSGEAVTAGIQTRGRGRRGREWSSNDAGNVQITFVLPHEPTARPAIAAAVGVAEGLANLAGESSDDRSAPGAALQRIGIKWPNDIVAGGRKLCGILIEQHGDRALVGVGVNVGARSWEGDLARKAVSLEELGVRPNRIDVLEAVIMGIDRAWGMNEQALAQSFSVRDVLRNTVARFECRGEVVEGMVVEVDVLRGLCVKSKVGMQWLDANATMRIE